MDTVFDDAMARFAPFGQCLHWSFAGHRGFAARSHGRVDVPDDALESLCLRFNVLVIEELERGHLAPKKGGFLQIFFAWNCFLFFGFIFSE